MKIPIYEGEKLPKKILKQLIPYSDTNYPILHRFKQHDQVIYEGERCTFVGVVIMKTAKPVTETFGYALQPPSKSTFIVGDVWNVRKVGDA